MIIRKTLSLRSIYEFTGHHLVWLTAWMLLVTSIYHFTHWKLMTIPWLPLSLIGTAVAFYVGFKNVQSYDRLWEARIIWGGITNNSRKFATMIKNYRSEEANADAGREVRKKIIFRHIGKYASFSFIFVCIFVFLLPFGIVGEFSKLGEAGIWLSVPVGVIIGWVYVVMELIGDYSENPFEGLHNDIPMLSICRNIEIDMLQLIGEKIFPNPFSRTKIFYFNPGR